MSTGAPPPPPVFSVSGPTTSSGTKSTSKKATGPTDQGAHNQFVAQLQSVYEGLWGVPAQTGYLQRAASSGMNIFEFEAHERAKPAFKFSPTYQEEELQTAMSLASKFGAFGYQ